MRALTMDEQALVSGGDGICVNVDGERIALGLGMIGTGATLLTAAEVALASVAVASSGGVVLIVGGAAVALGAAGGITLGSGITVTACTREDKGGS